MVIQAKRILLLMSVNFFTALPTHAHQIPCLERPAMAATLARHGEVRRAFGPSNAGGLVEVWAKPDGATWTIVVTTPGGLSCLVAEGQGWRRLEEPET